MLSSIPQGDRAPCVGLQLAAVGLPLLAGRATAADALDKCVTVPCRRMVHPPRGDASVVLAAVRDLEDGPRELRPVGAARGARLLWIDQLRGLAIVLVVAFHGRSVLARFEPGLPPELGAATAAFAPFRMPLLIFLSGMLLARSLEKPTGEFFAGKARCIAWPYVVWSVLFLVVSAQASVQELVRTLWDAPPHLWYLHHLLGYYAVAWLLRAVRIPLGVAAAAAFVLSFAAETTSGRRLLLMFVFFVAGHVYALNRHRVRGGRRAPWLVAGVAVATASGVASAAGLDLKYEPQWVLAPAAGILVCVAAAPLWPQGPAARALAFVGRESLVFYVSHFVVLWVTSWWFREAGVEGPLRMYVAGITIALLVGWALAHLRHRSRLVAALFEPPRLGAVVRRPR